MGEESIRHEGRSKRRKVEVNDDDLEPLTEENKAEALRIVKEWFDAVAYDPDCTGQIWRNLLVLLWHLQKEFERRELEERRALGDADEETDGSKWYDTPTSEQVGSQCNIVGANHFCADLSLFYELGGVASGTQYLMTSDERSVIIYICTLIPII